MALSGLIYQLGYRASSHPSHYCKYLHWRIKPWRCHVYWISWFYCRPPFQPLAGTEPRERGFHLPFSPYSINQRVIEYDDARFSQKRWSYQSGLHPTSNVSAFHFIAVLRIVSQDMDLQIFSCHVLTFIPSMKLNARSLGGSNDHLSFGSFLILALPDTT